jgi:hypothetical protein
MWMLQRQTKTPQDLSQLKTLSEAIKSALAVDTEAA